MKEALFRVLDREEAVLVLPTQRSVRHVLSLYARHRKTAIAASRAMSFDAFSALFNEDVGDKTQAGPIERALFASLFLSSHRDDLRSIYNSKYPEAQERAATFIAAILPSLPEGLPSVARQATRHDLELIQSAYKAFMDDHGLYEARWLEKDVAFFKGDATLTYVLACPSAELGMQRLLAQVGQPPFMEVLEPEGVLDAHVRLYENEKAEVLSLFDELEDLRDAGILMDDIMLTSPALKRLRPYLESEAARRAIPLSFEDDGRLLDTKVARYLSLIRECHRTKYDFSILERLFSDKSLPWLDAAYDEGQALLGAMIGSGVVSDADGRMESRLPSAKARGFLHRFRGHVDAVNRERDPDKLLAALQGLGDWLFGPTQFRGDEADSAVYSFIMDRYDAFSKLVRRLGAGQLGPLFSLFLTTLSSITYIKQERSPGISVNAYGHDYQLDVPYRFVFAMDEDGVRKEERPLSFLSEWEDDGDGALDATEAMLLCYSQSADRVRFSSSAVGWDGQHQVPFAFTSRGLVDEMAPYNARRHWKERELAGAGFERRSSRPPRNEDIGQDAVMPVGTPSSFSYSTVSAYAKCPFAAFAKNSLGIDEPGCAPDEADPREIGSFLHAVVEVFLENHKGMHLVMAGLPDYEAELEDIFHRLLPGKGFDDYTVAYLVNIALPGVRAFPRELVARCGGDAIPRGTELVTMEAGLTGRIDALVDYSDGTLLVDFKTRRAPDKRRYQLLMYMKMLNAQGGTVSVDDLCYYKFIYEQKNGEGHFENELRKTKSFEQAWQEMEADITYASEGWAAGRWCYTEDFDSCANCQYRPLCRRRFTLR